MYIWKIIFFRFKIWSSQIYDFQYMFNIIYGTRELLFKLIHIYYFYKKLLKILVFYLFYVSYG